jgi:hypothetical protein
MIYCLCRCPLMRTAYCHVGRTGTHLITKVKLCWAQLVDGGVTRESISGPVGRCTRILRLGSA